MKNFGREVKFLKVDTPDLLTTITEILMALTSYLIQDKIAELEHRQQKIFQLNKERKQKMMEMQERSQRDVGRGERVWAQVLFEDIVAETFPTFTRLWKPQAESIQSKQYQGKMKLLKNKEKNHRSKQMR